VQSPTPARSDPFDDRRGHAGAGTVGLELVEAVPDADVVVVPVGGGGLISGIATAVKGLRPEARIVAVEPEGSRALHEALQAGEAVRVGTLHDDGVLIIHHVFRPDNTVQILEVGAAIPWHACALGHAIVAHLPQLVPGACGPT